MERQRAGAALHTRTESIRAGESMDENKLQKRMDDFYRIKALREQIRSSVESIDPAHLPKIKRYLKKLL